ncbi:MAG: DegQ family serine endoprotease [Verrucomicrobiia bacterium]
MVEIEAAVSSSEQSQTTIQVDDGEINRGQGMVTSYAPIVKKVSQSVVNIFTTTTIHETDQGSPFSDPFFQQFFGFDPFGGQPRERIRKEQNLGSGVIVSKDGYILTNNHVVDRADEIQVALPNVKKTVDAKLVGKDPKTDIAVLKVDAPDLVPIHLGNSDKIEVGDVVLAIGNPFNIGQTVTMGIVSALGRRNVLDMNTYEDFIQTDAAINPGNSGGALVDAAGRLIGINSAILSRTGGNQGIGFAVPINLAQNVMSQILKEGRVIRGFLGVGIQEIATDLAQALNLPSEEGVVITSVEPQSAAAEAGLKEGDVILKMDGKPIEDTQQFRFTVGQKAPNAKINLTVFSNGKEKNVDVILKELKEGPAIANVPARVPEKSFLEGVVIGDLNDEIRRKLQVPLNLQGAVVMSIDEDAIAAQGGNGLHRGDVILELNQQSVSSANDLVKLSSDLEKRKLVLLRVWRQGATLFITVNLES